MTLSPESFRKQERERRETEKEGGRKMVKERERERGREMPRPVDGTNIIILDNSSERGQAVGRTQALGGSATRPTQH